MPTLKETLRKIMKRLADERPRFCSEADFQFALAWKIQESYPNAEIRFECPAKQSDKSIEIDIVANLGGKLFPMELKRKLERSPSGNTGGDTVARKQMLEDIEQLKKLQMEQMDMKNMNFTAIPKIITNCFAIWLSDNHRFWTEGGKNSFFDCEEYGIPKISWEDYAGEFRFALIEIAK